MIGKLKGWLDSKSENTIILDVQGVGYEILCSKRLVDQVKIGDLLDMKISMQFKEPNINLYGFLDLASKDMFIMLQSVNGVGAKMAISFLSEYTVDELIGIIISKRQEKLSKVSGVGTKIAKRIILELSNKVEKIQRHYNIDGITYESEEVEDYDQYQEIEFALVGLGMQKHEARQRIKKYKNKLDQLQDTGEMIKLCLQKR